MAQVPNKNNRLFEIFAATPTRIAVSLIVPVVTFLVLRWSFIFMRDSEASKFLIGIVALTIGVGGVWVLFAATNNLVSMLPVRLRDALRPFVFVGPAIAVLLFYIVFPALRPIYLGFMNKTSTEFVGLRNYEFVFTDP